MAKSEKPAATPSKDAAASTTTTTTEAAAPTSNQGRAITLTEGPGKGMRRIDYIRQEYNEGKGRKRGEIAKELGVAYQIVFAATKADKPAADAKDAKPDTSNAAASAATSEKSAA